MTSSPTEMESVGEILGRLAAEHNARNRPAKVARRWPNVWIIAAALVATVDVVMVVLGVQSGWVLPAFGYDFGTYRDAAQSWLGGSGFYYPYQLAGPYDPWHVSPQPSMYPPTAAPLLLVLTAIPLVWWVGPFLIVGWRLRHARERWPLALALLAWPGSWLGVITGNPGMWITAAVSLGLGSVVLLKPTLAPFLLTGIRTRRWWAFAAALALISLALVPQWFDYLTVLRNARGTDLWYSLWQWPLILIGVLAQHQPEKREQRQSGQDE